MSMLLAEFESAQAIAAGARRAVDAGFPARDALTPYPVPAMEAFVRPVAPRLRVTMAAAGFGVAIFAFLFQTWTAVYAYPFNSGDRPLFSWPVFVLVPFEVGVLSAGIAGFVAFLRRCGLPKLHHPVFEVGDIERASQDRFFLVLDHPEGDSLERLEALLTEAGAVSIAEAAAA